MLNDSDHPYWHVRDMFAMRSRALPSAPVTDIEQLIHVDLSEQIMHVYQDNYLILESPITSGKLIYKTPPGTYPVLEKLEGKWLNSPFPNDPYRLWVDYWIRLTHSGYGIHDTCNDINCWRTEF